MRTRVSATGSRRRPCPREGTSRGTSHLRGAVLFSRGRPAAVHLLRLRGAMILWSVLVLLLSASPALAADRLDVYGKDGQRQGWAAPGQLHIGDRFIDADVGDEEKEWEVASRPVTFKTGHEVRARIQRPGDPGTAREKCWAAHQKITVRRVTAAATRPQPEPDDVVDVEALHRELRRLRAEVLGLQEEKQDLERRNAHLAREME